MRNLSVFIENNDCVLDLDVPMMVPETMLLRHATIFWKYNNVTSDNGVVSLGSKDIIFEPGYWDFEMIRERLSGENVILSRDVPDRKCNILSKDVNLSLKRFGELLGFEPNRVIVKDTVTRSPGQVDVLRGLRYINVKCDAVDPRESSSCYGSKSIVLACLPIVSYETLNSSATNYFDINSIVATCSGPLTRLRFTVDSNVEHVVGVDALLNIVVE